MMEQPISDVENLTKTVNFNEGGGSDVEAGIQFIYHMREHLVDIGIATVYGLVVYALFLWITKKIKGYLWQKTLVIEKLKHDIEFFHQLMPLELLLNVEKLVRLTMESQVKRRKRKKQQKVAS